MAGISSLPPAGYLLAAAGGEPQTGVYWEPPLDKKPLPPAELRELLVEVVDRHLLSDVPIGLFLSGGIDSGALAAAAVSQRGRTPLRSLAVVFPDEPAQSEIDPSRRMARFVGTDHTEIAMSGQVDAEPLASCDGRDGPADPGRRQHLRCQCRCAVDLA